jgi:hypothetical protein
VHSFEALEEMLRECHGRPILVTKPVLYPMHPLARQNAGPVMESLHARAFHRRLPPGASPRSPP